MTQQHKTQIVNTWKWTVALLVPFTRKFLQFSPHQWKILSPWLKSQLLISSSASHITAQKQSDRSSMQASRSLRFSTEHEAFSLSTRIWAIFIFKVVLYAQNSSQNCLHESQWQALPLICTPSNWILFMCTSNTVGQYIQQKWHSPQT